jgi:hypothetical protein
LFEFPWNPIETICEFIPPTDKGGVRELDAPRKLVAKLILFLDHHEEMIPALVNSRIPLTGGTIDKENYGARFRCRSKLVELHLV